MDIPKARDILDFRFVQLEKILISSQVASSVVNCIATSSKYGLLFVGFPRGFKVIRLETVLQLDEIAFLQKRKRKEPADNYQCVDVPLLSTPTSLTISCDENTLSVSFLKDEVPFALMYDVRAFALPEPPYPFTEVRLSASPGTKVQDFAWNPSVPNEFAVCLTDGSLSVYQVENDTLKITGMLPPSEAVTALCWSPKGKQIVAGKLDGRLCQYKPNLQQSKIILPPSQSTVGSVASVCWLATTLFATVYFCNNGTKLILVSVPRNQNPTYTDFGDVCNGTFEREVRYWMQHIPEWKMVVCASSNSIETALIGYDDQGVWEQWFLEDVGRAELPLFQSQYVYPTGFGIINSSNKDIRLSETECYPPMPIFFLLGTSGILCPFHMLNLKPGSPSLITEQQTISLEGVRKGRVTLSLGKPAQTSTPAHPPKEMSENTLAPKTNLLKTRFPEEQQPPLSKISTLDVQKSSKFAFTPVTSNSANNNAPPLGFHEQPTSTNAQFSTSKPTDTSQDSVLNRKTSRSILTPVAPSKTTVLPKTPAQSQEVEKANSDNAYNSALFEEVKDFAKEIKESRQRISQAPRMVGSNEEMSQIRTQTFEMKMFCEDIKKTVHSINLDFHMLKGCLLDTFAIFEEVRSLDVRNKDPVYLSLLRKRALDPVSAKKLKEIRKMCQYFDSQLTEIHRRLDQDWEDYLAKKKKRKILRHNISGIETVYRTLYNNLNTIKSFEDQIEKIISVTKKKKLTFISSTPYLTPDTQKVFSQDLSTLADSLLKVSVSQPKGSKITVSKINDGKIVAEPLNMQKENTLREFLQNRMVPTIKATQIKNLKESRIVSAIQVMKETSWSQKKDSFGEVSQRENSVETDMSKSDPEVKEVLSRKESVKDQKSSTFPPISVPDANWAMSNSAKSSVSSIASGETVITSTPVIPISRTTPGSIFSGGILQGTPVLSTRPITINEVSKKSEVPPKPLPAFQASSQAPPPNITLPFDSPPVLMVAKSNAALVSAPVMVPIPSKTEPKITPVFNFGKQQPSVSSNSFSFNLTSQTNESSGSPSGPLPLFGPIKICEPTSFSTIGKPPATISSEVNTNALPSSTTSPFSLKESNEVFSTLGGIKPIPTLRDNGGDTGLFAKTSKDSVFTATSFSTTPVDTRANEGQYEDITPPETPSKSDQRDDENTEVTKVIEISVPKSSLSPTVKVKTVATSSTVPFSFKLPQSSNITTSTISAKPSFSLAHLLKSDTIPLTSDSSKPASTFQFGSVVSKDGAANFSFALPPENQQSSPTSTETATIAPIAVCSSVTSSSSNPVIKTVSANVTIPTNALSTAFTPVTSSSSDKELTATLKLEEFESSKDVASQPVSKESTPPPSSSSSAATVIEDKSNEISSVQEVEEQPPPPPPPYTATETITSITSTSASSIITSGSNPVFGHGSTLFGKPTPSTPPKGIFGQANAESQFATTPNSQTGGSLFGKMTSFSQSNAASFGQPTSPTPVFGAVTSQASPFGIFGQPSQQQPAAFGTPTTTQPTSFGSPSTAQPSGFGSPPNTQPSGFGSPPNTQPFGQPSTNSGFGAFGQQAQSSFSQPGAAFSSAKPLFGQSGSSVFGQAKPLSGSGVSFGQQSQGSLFDSNTSFFGGLGGQPSVENANKNVFGVPSFPNQSSPPTGLFGGQSPGGFGNTFGNNSFTGGSFSAGGTSVAETGFGAFNQVEQQKTPTKIVGAGTSPGFGAPPVFGGSPLFGSSPFGISNVQQNPSPFGGGSFGNSSTATPMFDALASQAPTFGSLSQQPGASPGFGSSPPVFGASPSFGGQSAGIGSQSSAFTQWRQ